MTLTLFKKAHLLASMALILGVSSNAAASEKVDVVASFSILGDLISEVGGEHIKLTTLVKDNGDAHVYSPTPQDAQAVKNAQLLVVNGLNFEGWMQRLLESSQFNGVKVTASDGINVLQISGHEEEHKEHADKKEEAEHHHQGPDPHAWNSITNVKIYVNNIQSGLSQVDPDNSQEYKKNAAIYIAKLNKLESKLRKKMEMVPLTQRKVITPHDAFGYLAHDFDLEFMAPQGISTESEASASDVATIIKQIRRDNINAVFIENIADNRMVEQIIRETDTKVGGKLFSDALSEPEGPASTYLDMIEHNVTTIVDALIR
ncbi:metal ABC transporter substrate-binding protein [Psychromonas sp. SP041]|uniref:metal ABC transporter substrate-binding protein n=1 Tax=Psychromonas sp. SP041 TaxID=1365007 RepID=UPI0010C7A7A4|nr:metal ABC transporter substrate-binding protein [Psychromonas sp. SP041]